MNNKLKQDLGIHKFSDLESTYIEIMNTKK